MPRQDSSISNKLQSLSLNTTTSKSTSNSTSKPSTTKPALKKPTQPPVADSWDDNSSEEEDSDDDTETEACTRPISIPTSPSAERTTNGTAAPPPTPASSRPPTSSAMSAANPAFAVHDLPSYALNYSTSTLTSASDSGSGSRKADPGAKRPEKTTQTAARMIAGALGVRAKRTEEEKRYDKVVRENERKRREREREEERAREVRKEEARKGVWEDG